MNITNLNQQASNMFNFNHTPDDEPSGFEFGLDDVPGQNSVLVVRAGSGYVSIRQDRGAVRLHVDTIEGLAALLPKIRKLQKVAK